MRPHKVGNMFFACAFFRPCENAIKSAIFTPTFMTLITSTHTQVRVRVCVWVWVKVCALNKPKRD